LPYAVKIQKPNGGSYMAAEHDGALENLRKLHAIAQAG
jgi:hypothetical protein